jgi:hypothetical protein
MCIFIVKQSGLALYILDIVRIYLPDIVISDEFTNLIASIFGLITRLSIKGVIEDIFKDIREFNKPALMTMGDDPNLPETEIGGNPQEGNPNSSETGGSSASQPDPSTSSSNPGSSQPGPSASSSSATQLNSSGNDTGYVKGYASRRYIQIFSEEAQRISSEIKDLSLAIQNCQDEAERVRKEDDLEELFGMLNMLEEETREHTRKLLGTDNTPNDNKRAAIDDDSLSQNSSKKR